MSDRTGTQPTSRAGGTARRRVRLMALTLGLTAVALALGAVPSHAAKPATTAKPVGALHTHGHVTNAQRAAAALRAAALRTAAAAQGKAATEPALGGKATPDYFGTIPNYANSPLPRGPIGTASSSPTVGSGYSGAVNVKITDVSWGFGKGATAKAKVVGGVIKSITSSSPV